LNLASREPRDQFVQAVLLDLLGETLLKTQKDAMPKSRSIKR